LCKKLTAKLSQGDLPITTTGSTNSILGSNAVASAK